MHFRISPKDRGKEVSPCSITLLESDVLGGTERHAAFPQDHRPLPCAGRRMQHYKVSIGTRFSTIPSALFRARSTLKKKTICDNFCISISMLLFFLAHRVQSDHFQSMNLSLVSSKVWITCYSLRQFYDWILPLLHKSVPCPPIHRIFFFPEKTISNSVQNTKYFRKYYGTEGSEALQPQPHTWTFCTLLIILTFDQLNKILSFLPPNGLPPQSFLKN